MGQNPGEDAAGSLQPGEVRLGSLSKFNVQIVLPKDGALIARKEKGKKGCAKIPPKTVLATYNQGGVSEVKDASPMAFAFSKGKDLVVDSSDMSVTTLAEMIKKYNAVQLFAHAPFAKGVSPPSFAIKKKMGFVPKDAEAFNRIRKASEACAKAHLLWVVQFKDDKILPKSLAVVTVKQVLVKDADESL